MGYVPRLKQKYRDEIVSILMKEYGYKTAMQVPRLKKISLNQGLGRAAQHRAGDGNALCLSLG